MQVFTLCPKKPPLAILFWVYLVCNAANVRKEHKPTRSLPLQRASKSSRPHLVDLL
jgi:hypothetical protein